MSEEQKNKLTEDQRFDADLASVMGYRFQDLSDTANPSARVQNQQQNIYDGRPKTAAGVCKNHEASKAPDARYEPVPDHAPNWYDRLKGCVKWTLTFGALSCLFFYWQQTGLMAPQAAVPSMCACTLLVGWGVGKNAVK